VFSGCLALLLKPHAQLHSQTPLLSNPTPTPTQALYGAFMRADAECKRRFRKGGTTATVAVACGWELLTASVGDSCAYLDTGREIMLVSANHRIDDNADERARIVQAGGESRGWSWGWGGGAGWVRAWVGGRQASTQHKHVRT